MPSALLRAAQAMLRLGELRLGQPVELEQLELQLKQQLQLQLQQQLKLKLKQLQLLAVRRRGRLNPPPFRGVAESGDTRDP